MKIMTLSRKKESTRMVERKEKEEIFSSFLHIKNENFEQQLTGVGRDCPECLCEKELMGAPLGIWRVSDEKTTRSQSMPIDDDCPLTAICSTRQRHGSRKTGLSSEQVTHSDECTVVKIKAKIASERRNFILK